MNQYTAVYLLDKLLSAIHFLSILLIGVGFGGANIAVAQFSGGSGSEEDPYHIASVEDLQLIGEAPESHFVVTEPIDASETGEWNSGQGFNPIENFSGQIDGGGYVISNLHIQRSQKNVGLIGTNHGKLNNLALEDVTITGGLHTGGLAGRHEGEIIDSYVTGTVESVSRDDRFSRAGILVGSAWDAVISNSYTEGTIHANKQKVAGIAGSVRGSVIEGSHSNAAVSGEDDEIGGIAGQSDGGTIIRECFATGNITGSNGAHDVGGLVGENEGSTILDSYATGDVYTDGEEVGGLAGENEEGSSIIRSYATGNVVGEGDMVGGLVGEHEDSIIDKSFATGNVTGGAHEVGGLVGESETGSIIRRSYATGNVSARGRKAGGLVGENENSLIEKSFAAGHVQGYSEIGGLVGRNNGGTLRQSYWDSSHSGRSEGVGDGSSDGVTGRTTEQMYRRVSFENWDFDEVWTIEENRSYPYHRQLGEPISAGDLDDPDRDAMEGLRLDENYPNPFNRRTTIVFDLPEVAGVKLEVFDAIGRHITTLVDEIKHAGSYEVIWEATGKASGIYICRLRADGVVVSGVMTLVK